MDVVLERRGTYGSLQVAWLTGFPENEGPDGFSRGKLSEESGRVSMLNGENRTAFKIQVRGSDNTWTIKLFPATSFYCISF